MSFTITQSVPMSSYSSLFGISSDSGDKNVDVTYSVSKIISFDGNMVTAEFDVSIGGYSTSQPYRFSFPYSGSGNPMDQAEDKLSSYLSGISTPTT